MWKNLLRLKMWNFITEIRCPKRICLIQVTTLRIGTRYGNRIGKIYFESNPIEIKMDCRGIKKPCWSHISHEHKASRVYAIFRPFQERPRTGLRAPHRFALSLFYCFETTKMNFTVVIVHSRRLSSLFLAISLSVRHKSIIKRGNSTFCLVSGLFTSRFCSSSLVNSGNCWEIIWYGLPNTDFQGFWSTIVSGKVKFP